MKKEIMSKKRVRPRNVTLSDTGRTNKNVKFEGFANGNACSPGSSCDDRRQADTSHSAIRAEGTRAKTFTLEDGDLFPRWILWILFPVTLVFRVCHVLDPQNWWILHPDEVYQTIEAAHTDAFGFGFRAYEYMPPVPDSENASLSDAQQLEIDLGMYGLRAFILPKLLSVIMLTVDCLGFDISPFLSVKVFHVVVTSLLPVSVYWFSYANFRCNDISVLSAIFAATSCSLNILDTHTFINSFTAPVVFIALIPLLRTLRTAEGSKTDAETLKVEGENSEKQGTPYKRVDKICGDANSEALQKLSHTQDENANVILDRGLKKCVKSKLKLYGLHCQNVQTDSLRSLLSLLNVDNVRREFEEIWCLKKSVCIAEFCAGLMLGVCVYVRFDIILIPAFLVVINLNQIPEIVSKPDRTKEINYILGFIAGIAFGGFCDSVVYGRWFLSPWQWIKFNVWNSSAGAIFGTNSFFFYISKLSRFEPFFILVLLFLTFKFVAIYLTKHITKEPLTHCNDLECRVGTEKASNQSVLLVSLLIFSFSCNSHKELRFIHNVIVLFYISLASAIQSLYTFFAAFLSNQKYRQYYNVCTYLFISLFISSHMSSFYHLSQKDRHDLSYGRNGDSQDVNMCLEYIRRQPDVTGVFLDYSIHVTGAYSILHKEVPLFVKNINEYMEYNNGDSNAGNRITIFNKISDFVSTDNLDFLYRLVSEKPVYNFLILNQNVQSSTTSYVNVYEAGHFKVLKRIPIEDASGSASSKKILVGSSAPVLEHEGYWLKHFGLYEKAEQRLIAANRLDPRRIGVFRLLLNMYQKLNQKDDYWSVLSACQQIHTRRHCLEGYVQRDIDTI